MSHVGNLNPSCPQCRSRAVRLKQVIPEDPSIGVYDEVRVYDCGNCGVEFNSRPNPPERNPNRFDRFPIHADDKEILLGKVQQILGREEPGIRKVLRLLAHPDVIGYTKKYFDAMDVNSMCTKYESPWSCAREAEARYENIHFGFLGAGSGIGFDDSWCDNCKKKVLGG